jgi:hypothetical protein
MPKIPALKSSSFDEVAIRDHVGMIHGLAGGLDGVLAVSAFHANPNKDEDTAGVVSRHAIGDVEGTVESIMCHSETPHLNVFIGLQVMRKGLARAQRGTERDIVAVLGLVVDMDADTGKTGDLPVLPNLVLETSPGNRQPFILFDRPIPASEAKPLAAALRRATGSDHGTADVTHLWRVPGTFNWPNRKKLSRGRSELPADVFVEQEWQGDLIAVEDLKAALAPWMVENTAFGQSVTLGEIPVNVNVSDKAAAMLAANDVGDRSEWASAVVEQLAFDGMTAEAAYSAFTSASGNWFERYDSKDPEKDFVRCWAKFGQPHEAARAASAELASAFVAKNAAKAPLVAANDNEPAPTLGTRPVDPWAQRKHPSMPLGLLPAAIEEFATSQAAIMGVDAGGLAASALAVCAAAIPDAITLRVKRHDDWEESARLWVALIGNPSAKKSPVISTATRALRSIDDELVQNYISEKRKYDALDKAGKAETSAPRQVRTRIEDVTVEAAQEVLKDTPQGVLLIRDELSGWFGSMERYGTGKGASADRSFWLQAFNGGGYSVNRVGRGVVAIDNLSVSMLGGIQPEPIRKIVADSADDGLLQRLFPICMGTATVGLDVPPAAAVGEYGGLIRRLHSMKRPMQAGMREVALRFDNAGQDLRAELEVKHHAMAAGWEILNKKLAAHIGKYDGLFARLCIVFHCVETTGDRPAHVIPFDVARRAADFLHEFLFPHSLAFYQNVLGMSDKQDALLSVAGWILTHRPEKMTVRDVQRGDRIMREMDREQAEDVLRRLDAMSWLEPMPTARRDSITYVVNPDVYVEFEHRAEKEKGRRERVRELIASSC